jgi:hypothetical protein
VVFFLLLPSVCLRPGVVPCRHNPQWLRWRWRWARAQPTPSHLHGVVGFQLVVVGVDQECPLEDGDPFPEGGGHGEHDAGVLDGEGASYVDKSLKGFDSWRGDVGEDGGPGLVPDELSIQAV